MEYLPETVQRGMRAVNHWIMRNISRTNQTLILLAIFFAMCLHLRYTKRKVQDIEKEKQLGEKQQKKKQ